MRTVQRTYTLFGIAELEDEARQRAYTDWLAKGNDYPYASENCDTLEAFCNLFRIVCTNYRYDSCTYAYRFYTKHEADTEELSGVRLLAYLYNNFHAGLYKPRSIGRRPQEKAQEPYLRHLRMPLHGRCVGRNHLATPHGLHALARHTEFQGTHA